METNQRIGNRHSNEEEEMEVDYHTLRKSQHSIKRQALLWNLQGQRKMERQRKSWKRSVKEEARKGGKSWGELKILARNRVRWSCFVEALCSDKSNRTYYYYCYY